MKSIIISLWSIMAILSIPMMLANVYYMHKRISFGDAILVFIVSLFGPIAFTLIIIFYIRNKIKGE